MLSFEKEFDLEDVFSIISNDYKSDLSREESKLKCIGFQSDLVLFCCNVVADEKVVTKLGYYCLQEKDVVDLYTHPGVMDVLVGSLNTERNMLVYARRKSPKSSSFQSCLVELITMKTFDLNIESPQTQHLMFFPWRNAKEKGNRKEHLVFFIEKTRLGVIHITTTLNKENKLEVQQIQKEVLVQHYVWYQIDLTAMRLYYIYLQQKVSEGGVKTCNSMFNVYQFSSRSNPEIALSVSLPLPLTPDLYSASKRYMVGPTSCTIPDSRVNITVLRPCSSVDSLVLCIGYNAQYHVYIIHTGNLVSCEYGELKDTSQGVAFFHMADYVFVYAPHSGLHCIDASSAHLPRNSMVFEDVKLNFPLQGEEEEPDFIQHPGKDMPLCPVKLLSGKPALIVYQSSIYRVELRSENLLEKYRSVSCPATWSFLMHFALSHCNDHKVAHRMLLHSLKCYPKTDISGLLKEFLLTSSHATLSQQDGITAAMLSALPYANEESQLALLDRNRALKITNVFSTITKPMLTSQKVLNIVATVGPFIRFSLEEFVSRCGHMVRTPGAGSSTQSTSSNPPSSNSSNEDSSLLSHEDDDEAKYLADTICNALEFHIKRRFNETIRLNHCQDAARQYLADLAKHCRIALSLILISTGRYPDWYPEPDCLLDCDDEPRIKQLMKLLNLLKLVMIQLGCPAPMTFEWLHVYTAYKSSSRELFLRKLASKSVKISPVTVKKFLGVMPKDHGSQMLCSALVSTLSRSQALQALKSWDSATYRSFTAQNYLAALRSKAEMLGPVEPVTDTPTYLRTHPFIPVNSFYSYLYHKMQSPNLAQKLQALSDMSMERTKEQESATTLQNITFY